MKRAVAAMIVLLALTGSAMAQVPPMRRSLVVESNPIDSIEEMSIVYRSDDDEAAVIHIEIVTGGIKVNWIGQPHSLFVINPRPDLFLPYVTKYHSYCRLDRPTQDGTSWERNGICIAERGGVIFFQSFRYRDQEWNRHIVLFKEVP